MGIIINTRDLAVILPGLFHLKGFVLYLLIRGPTGKTLVLAANEVSGTVAIFEVY